jgi:molybdopterin-guanine dinucleotide biosynthesis protein A
MNAIILAGGNLDPGDPLFDENPNQPKSLIDVAGKPMVQWVIDALDRAQLTKDLVVVGLEGIPGIRTTKPLHFLPDHGSLLANVEASLSFINQVHPEDEHALVASADIPAITPEIVDWRIKSLTSSDIDVDYAVVSRSVMERRFPDARRSYVHLRDIDVCGGDINILKVGLAQDAVFWEKVVEARKSAFRQAKLIGYRFLLLILLRRMRLKDAELYVSDRLELNACVTVSPYAEVAMDIDKPDQLAIMRADLSKSMG